MAYELKDGQGNLFKNDKGDNPKRPDYRGEINVGGTTYSLSAWLRESDKGTKYMSISTTPKDSKAKNGPAPKPSPSNDFDQSDVPF